MHRDKAAALSAFRPAPAGLSTRGDFFLKRLFVKTYSGKKPTAVFLSSVALLLVVSLIVSLNIYAKNPSQKAVAANKNAVSAASSGGANTSEDATGGVILPKKVCYLTFDDGPSDRTPEILTVLDNYGVKATFFVIGVGKLSLIPEIVSRGHTIGLHSDTHNYSAVYASDDAYFNDLAAVSDKVENITGKKPVLVRFPGGSDNIVSRICPGLMSRLTVSVREKGYQYVDWNIVANDTTPSLMQNIGGVRMTPPPTILQSVISGSTKSDGTDKEEICVLMHDAKNKYSTVDALSAIIENLLSRGYTLLPLDENSPVFHAAKLNN